MKEKAIKVLDDGEHIFEVDLKKFKKEIRIWEYPKSEKMAEEVAQKTPKNINFAENHKYGILEKWGDGNDGVPRSLKLI
jgi:hypothetical protein